LTSASAIPNRAAVEEQQHLLGPLAQLFEVAAAAVAVVAAAVVVVGAVAAAVDSKLLLEISDYVRF